MKRHSVPLVVFVLLLNAAVSPQASPGRAFVSFDPIDTVVARAGKPSPVEFQFHIQNGYHINSNQPTTPELIPTQLHFSLPGDVSIAKLQYPAGQLTSFPFDPTQKLSVYSGQLTIKALVVPASKASPGAHTIHGELRYQACDNNACYPPKKLPIQFNVQIEKPKKSAPRNKPQSPHIHQ
jgi:hypothetical protein